MTNTDPNTNPNAVPSADPDVGGAGSAPGNTRVRAWLRAGLAFLTAVQFGVGCWALLFPRSFFDVQWVGMGMAYNAHLMMDYGAMSLATSVVLGVGVVTMRRTIVRTALAVYLVFAGPHFVIHVRLLHHLSPTQGRLLLSMLAGAIVIPTVLLFLSRHAPAEGGRPTRPGGRWRGGVADRSATRATPGDFAG
ncbi:hypothetical protein [Embleya sp. NBC_00896]|uniref:hypothetical protein n=1 Tax=Embleya sp. NBC_00896 TaxID=2975961 RepID=UPI002F906F9B|nr:hypothetical protein OG928_37695 [Embleya sp. NBC_00896]